jgi:hypothetical protein
VREHNCWGKRIGVAPWVLRQETGHRGPSLGRATPKDAHDRHHALRNILRSLKMRQVSSISEPNPRAWERIRRVRVFPLIISPGTSHLSQLITLVWLTLRLPQSWRLSRRPPPKSTQRCSAKPASGMPEGSRLGSGHRERTGKPPGSGLMHVPPHTTGSTEYLEVTSALHSPHTAPCPDTM